jgi:hypothetical protein
MRTVFTGSSAVAVFPLLCYLALFASAVHTSFIVGHWPSYGNPDPHHLPTYRLASFAALFGLVGVLLCPVMLAAALGARVKLRKSPLRLGPACAFYCTGAFLWAWDFMRWRSVSGGGLVDWIFD